MPWYRGFTGTIEPVGDNFVCRGAYTVSGHTVTITDLPVGVWTTDYVEHLTSLSAVTVPSPASKKPVSVKKPTVISFTNESTDLLVRFTVRMEPEAVSDVAALEKTLKLVSTISSKNMHAFDDKCRIAKYASAEEVIAGFYRPRLKGYQMRRLALIDKYTAELAELESRVRFIVAVMDGEIVVFRRPIADLRAELQAKQFPIVEGGYDYLFGIRTSSYTAEKVAELNAKKDEKKALLEETEKATKRSMWRADLEHFLEKLKDYEGWVRERSSETKTEDGGTGNLKKRPAGKGVTAAAAKKAKT